MKTDADALAAYFEAWVEGWPVPGGWDRFGGSWRRIGAVGHHLGDSYDIDPSDPDAIDIQALTGVLVVELAKSCGATLLPLTHSVHDNKWYVNVQGTWFSKPTALCALVAAWLEVNK